MKKYIVRRRRKAGESIGMSRNAVTIKSNQDQEPEAQYEEQVRHYLGLRFGIDLTKEARPLSGNDIAGLYDNLRTSGKQDAVSIVRKIRGKP
jgi:hypothetical protein